MKHSKRTKSGKHKAAPKLLRGEITVTSRGIGLLDNELFDEAVEIENNLLNTALHGDTVEVLVTKPPIRSKSRLIARPKGEVKRVTKRAKTSFVGVIEKENGVWFLSPDDKRVYADFILEKPEAHRAESGLKALVRLKKWTNPRENPIAELIKVIGKKGEHETEMQSIALEKGFDTSYPREAAEEAEMIAKREKPIPKAEIGNRRDFRKTLTFTIDPADAKDFDDAISFKPLGKGLCEIGVHIADVSHYVRVGTELDREAKARALSVYLVDRTIPMLPEILSNDLCSLNPNEDKLAFSAVFVMDDNGSVRDSWFGKTVIRSAKRFTYEEAQKSITDPASPHHKELDILNKIAKKLRESKFSKGAIDFEQDEVKFVLDENMKPVKVYRKERLDAHKLVEEYMLLANKKVAEFLSKESPKSVPRPSIYRIHGMPDADRISDLAIFVRALGYDLPVKSGSVTAKDIQALMKKVEGKAEESLIKTAAVRSMAKAIYSTKNIGHFGLAFRHYTHFTSPIRRYPDLLVHRALAGRLYGEKISRDEVERLERIAAECTEKEISAAEAERASIKYKQVEYMQERIGKEFDGVISGVTEWGMYVEEAETRAEGMIRLRDLGDDYYELDQKNYALVGQKTKKRFTLGDKVRFKVMGADLEKKVLDFKLV